MKPLEKFNTIHDEYKGEFQQRMWTIHSLLWQIMINERFKGKVVVFHVVVSEDGCKLVVAHGLGGYWDTGVVFKSDNYNDCSDIAEEMSFKVFGHDIKEYNVIMSNSMAISET